MSTLLPLLYVCMFIKLKKNALLKSLLILFASFFYFHRLFLLKEQNMSLFIICFLVLNTYVENVAVETDMGCALYKYRHLTDIRDRYVYY